MADRNTIASAFTVDKSVEETIGASPHLRSTSAFEALGELLRVPPLDLNTSVLREMKAIFGEPQEDVPDKRDGDLDHAAPPGGFSAESLVDEIAGVLSTRVMTTPATGGRRSSRRLASSRRSRARKRPFRVADYLPPSSGGAYLSVEEIAYFAHDRPERSARRPVHRVRVRRIQAVRAPRRSLRRAARRVARGSPSRASSDGSSPPKWPVASSGPSTRHRVEGRFGVTPLVGALALMVGCGVMLALGAGVSWCAAFEPPSRPKSNSASRAQAEVTSPVGSARASCITYFVALLQRLPSRRARPPPRLAGAEVRQQVVRTRTRSAKANWEGAENVH